MAVGDWEEIGWPPSSATGGFWGAYGTDIFFFGNNDEIWKYSLPAQSWSLVPSGTVYTAQNGGAVPRVEDRFYFLRAGKVYHADSNSFTDIAIASTNIESVTRLPNTAKLYYNEGDVRFWEFDTETNTYTQRADIPYEPLTGNKGIVAYGESVYSVCGGGNEVAKYDVTTDSWQLLPSDMISGSTFSSADPGVAAMDNRIYVWGGGSSSNLHVYYDLDQLGWVRLDPTPVNMTGASYTNHLGFHYSRESATDSIWRFHATDVLESGDPFSGEDGIQLSPAPEHLPHVITMHDVEGNQPLQRKLQENFDSIQRQLLALDPDTADSRDPMDR